MSSRRHYVAQANNVLYYTPSRLVRGDNVPDSLLTPEQLQVRRLRQSYISKAKYKLSDHQRRLALRGNVSKPGQNSLGYFHIKEK